MAHLLRLDERQPPPHAGRSGLRERRPERPPARDRVALFPSPESQVLRLQRTAGNSAVAALLAGSDAREVIQRVTEPGDLKEPRSIDARGKPMFAAGKPHPSDVKQNFVGDCQLITVLDALADKAPGVVKAALPGGDGPVGETVKVDIRKPKNAVAIADADFGPKETIETSSRLPTKKGGLKGVGKPSGPWWAAFVEKGFAIALGSYSSLTGMSARTSFKALGTSESLVGRQLTPPTVSWENLAVVVASMEFSAHNYRVVRTTAEGPVLRDPRTEFDPEAWQREVSNPTAWPLSGQPNSDNEWKHMYKFTWGQFKNWFKNVVKGKPSA